MKGDTLYLLTIKECISAKNIQIFSGAADENKIFFKLGFMSGEIKVPDDFDTMESEVLSDLFEGRLS